MKNIKKTPITLLLFSTVILNLGLQANSAFSQTINTEKDAPESQEKCINYENHEAMKDSHPMESNQEMIMGDIQKNQAMIMSNNDNDCTNHENNNHDENHENHHHNSQQPTN